MRQERSKHRTKEGNEERKKQRTNKIKREKEKEKKEITKALMTGRKNVKKKKGRNNHTQKTERKGTNKQPTLYMLFVIHAYSLLSYLFYSYITL